MEKINAPQEVWEGGVEKNQNPAEKRIPKRDKIVGEEEEKYS